MKRKIPRWVWGCLISFLVLGVLVVILFPCGCVSREKARQASCNSNERQVGLAIIQYAEDNDGYLPSGINGNGYGWAGQVQNYIKSEGVFKCPDDPTSPTDNNPPLSGHAVSYGMNRNLSRRRVRIGQLPNTAKTVMVFEVQGVIALIDKPDEGKRAGATRFSATGDGIDGSLVAGTSDAKYATGYMGKRPISAGLSQFDGPTGRHTDGANYLLGDGHVKFLMPDRVSTGSDAKHNKDAQTGGIVGKAAGTENMTFDATFSTK